MTITPHHTAQPEEKNMCWIQIWDSFIISVWNMTHYSYTYSNSENKINFDDSIFLSETTADKSSFDCKYSNMSIKQNFQLIKLLDFHWIHIFAIIHLHDYLPASNRTNCKNICCMHCIAYVQAPGRGFSRLPVIKYNGKKERNNEWRIIMQMQCINMYDSL